MTARLEKAIKQLPPEKLEELANYAELLVERTRAGAAARPMFRWAGALADLKDQYTSVELQHKASDWRSGG